MCLPGFTTTPPHNHHFRYMALRNRAVAPACLSLSSMTATQAKSARYSQKSWPVMPRQPRPWRRRRLQMVPRLRHLPPQGVEDTTTMRAAAGGAAAAVVMDQPPLPLLQLPPMPCAIPWLNFCILCTSEATAAAAVVAVAVVAALALVEERAAAVVALLKPPMPTTTILPVGPFEIYPRAFAHLP